jgi:hypothetical protein
MSPMQDDDNTAPIAVGEPMPPQVTILAEVTEGQPALIAYSAHGTRTGAEGKALEFYRTECRADAAQYLDHEQRAAAQERWLNRLRSGRPAHLSLGKTLRMRTLMVQP